MVMLLLSLPLTGPSAACTRRLDLATAPRLAEVLEWLSRADTGELYVDTAELTFCDCAGLSVLLAAVQRRQAHGGRLVLTNAAPILRRVSHLLGLDTALGLTPAHRPTTLNAHAEPRGP
jgi:anti-sigma B factor antagonist